MFRNGNKRACDLGVCIVTCRRVIIRTAAPKRAGTDVAVLLSFETQSFPTSSRLPFRAIN